MISQEILLAIGQLIVWARIVYILPEVLRLFILGHT
jgi:hypothetical protein